MLSKMWSGTQFKSVRSLSLKRFEETIIISTAVASMRRTEALASVKFYQILSIFIFFIRLIILEDFIRLISYNGPCVRLGCSFFLATALMVFLKKAYIFFYHSMQIFLPFLWSSAHETCPANNYLYK